MGMVMYSISDGVSTPVLAKPGQYIKHEPNNSYYYVVGRTKIKTYDGSWLDGLLYIKAEKVAKVGFAHNLDDILTGTSVFVRPEIMFDSDWRLVATL